MNRGDQEYIRKKLEGLRGVFAEAVLGNFDQQIEIPEDDDQMAELYSGIQIMLEVIHEKLTELEKEVGVRKRIEDVLMRNQLELKAILDSIGDGLIVTDNEGKVTAINGVGEKLLGWRSSEIVGKSLIDVIPAKDEDDTIIPPDQRPILLTLKSGKRISATFLYQRRDTTTFVASVVVTPLKVEDKIIGSVEVFRDITYQREFEKRKDDFIALASHEMKTPVTSLKIFNQLLEKRLQEKNETEFMPQLENINKQLMKLTNLINDLLDASRAKQGKIVYKKQPFSVVDLIQETVEDMQGISKTHEFIIRDTVHVNILADRARIEQVLVNLMNNAVKYSPKSDKVMIGAFKDDESVTIYVQDFGMGIPEKEQKEIFDRFYQVNNPQAKTYPGLGLGLYISAKIIDHHGGKLWVESEEGKGSTFYFTLPLNKKE